MDQNRLVSMSFDKEVSTSTKVSLRATLLLLVAVLTAACGQSASTAPANLAGPQPKNTHTSLSTTTTAPLIGDNVGIAPLCRSYDFLVSSYILSPQIAQLSSSESQAATSRALSAIKQVAKKATSIGVPQQQILGLSSFYQFTPTNSKARSANADTTLAALRTYFTPLCQPMHPTGAIASQMQQSAINSGILSKCVQGSTYLISSADPTYGVVVASGANCYSDGSSGVALRISNTGAAMIQRYTEYPCGQMPPWVIENLFGDKAVTTCYPGGSLALN